MTGMVPSDKNKTKLGCMSGKQQYHALYTTEKKKTPVSKKKLVAAVA